MRGSGITKSAFLAKGLNFLKPYLGKTPLAQMITGGGGGYAAGKAYDNSVVPGLEVDVTNRQNRYNTQLDNYNTAQKAYQDFAKSIKDKEYKDQLFGDSAEVLRQADQTKLKDLLSSQETLSKVLKKSKSDLEALKGKLSDRKNFTTSNFLDILTGGALGKRYFNKNFLSGGNFLKGPALKVVGGYSTRNLDKAPHVADTIMNTDLRGELDKGHETARAIGGQISDVGKQLGETTTTVQNLLPYGAGIGGGLGGGLLGSLVADATGPTTVGKNLSEKEKEEARRKARRRKSMFALGGTALGGLAGYLGGGGRFGLSNTNK